MHLRSLRSLATFTLPTLVLLGLASPAAGAPGEKDKDALKLHDDAINNDYLNAEFPKAITKLKDALKLCGAASCSANVVAKIHISLGTIYGAAMTPPKIPEAQAEFELALKTDPTAALDPSLTYPERDQTFAAAKKAVAAGGAGGATGAGGAGGAGGGKKPPPASSGGEAGIHTPPPEQVVNTPVPLYLEPSEEVPLSKVTLRYKPFGSKTYKSLELKKIGKGFGGEVPCEDVTTTGDIKYFFALFDENGEAAGTLGSTKEPYKVTLKNELEGDGAPPSLPGKKPPEACAGQVVCPPDFPGCHDPGKTPPGDTPKEKRGDRGWGASCEETMQCQEGLGCKDGTCQEGGGNDPVAGAGDWKKWKNTKYHHMVGLGAQFDILSIGSRDNVCSPPGPGETANYSCFVTGTDTQFDGKIVTRTGTNGIQGGGAYADTRLFAAYDLFLFEKKVPVSIGLRFGYAIGGSPTPTNVTKNVPPALGFQAISFEARGSYFLLGSMFEKRKPRPYIFVGGGSGQVNAAVPVTVCDSTAKDASKNNCKTSPKSAQSGVDAYQVTGLGFVEFGGGTTFGITDHFGVAAELKFMFMVPTFGFVFAPTVGPVVAF